jgi:hypothetical protein
MEKQQYQIEYETFLQGYKVGLVSGEQIGEAIAHMVQHFCNQNLSLVAKEEITNKVAAKNVNLIDEATDKLISVSKADLLTKACPEYVTSSVAKVHLENIEQCINALKALQKGAISEYSHLT